MATYVHAPGVSNYPSSPQGAKTKRLEGQLCDQCRDKEKQGTCQS